jgi:hypothetical protein
VSPWRPTGPGTCHQTSPITPSCLVDQERRDKSPTLVAVGGQCAVDSEASSLSREIRCQTEMAAFDRLPKWEVRTLITVRKSHSVTIFNSTYVQFHSHTPSQNPLLHRRTGRTCLPLWNKTWASREKVTLLQDGFCCWVYAEGYVGRPCSCSFDSLFGLSLCLFRLVEVRANSQATRVLFVDYEPLSLPDI